MCSSRVLASEDAEPSVIQEQVVPGSASQPAGLPAVYSYNNIWGKQSRLHFSCFPRVSCHKLSSVAHHGGKHSGMANP